MAERDPIAVLADDPEVKPLLAINYLRPHVREQMEEELQRMDDALADPIKRSKIVDVGRITAQQQARRQWLTRQTPPAALPASVKDKLAKLRTLCLDSFREGMPSHEEMRHRPSGAQDKHAAWTRAKKRDVVLYKRATLLLVNPDTTGREVASIEGFRPAHAQTRDLYGDAQIPGVWGLSPQAKAHYDAIDWGDPEVLARARRELTERGELRREGYTVKKRKSSARQYVEKGKSYDCTEHEKFWSGPMAKVNYARHMKAAHPEG